MLHVQEESLINLLRGILIKVSNLVPNGLNYRKPQQSSLLELLSRSR